MAKKKVAGPNEGEAASRTRSAPKKLTAKPATVDRPLSSVEIGNTAGDVWQALATHGPQTLASLKKQVPLPADIVVAAVGWLAREGKLSFRSSGRSVLVELREEG